jgi:hypothetical protein
MPFCIYHSALTIRCCCCRCCCCCVCLVDYCCHITVAVATALRLLFASCPSYFHCHYLVRATESLLLRYRMTRYWPVLLPITVCLANTHTPFYNEPEVLVIVLTRCVLLSAVQYLRYTNCSQDILQFLTEYRTASNSSEPAMRVTSRRRRREVVARSPPPLPLATADKRSCTVVVLHKCYLVTCRRAILPIPMNQQRQ